MTNDQLRNAPRLPRVIEGDDCHAAVQAALAATPRPVWAGATVVAAVVPLTDVLCDALRSARMNGNLVRGLEATERTLDVEQRGLAALPAGEAERHGKRVSRLLLVANDGAARLYRRVERLVVSHAPRVLPCIVDCDSATLGTLLYGPGETAKLVLAEHKTAVTTILRALARR